MGLGERLDSIAIYLDNLSMKLFDTPIIDDKCSNRDLILQATVTPYVLPRLEVHLHELSHAMVGSLLGFKTRIEISNGFKLPLVSDFIELVSNGFIRYNISSVVGNLNSDIPAGICYTAITGPASADPYPSLALQGIAGPFASSIFSGFLIRDGWKRKNLAGLLEQVYGAGSLLFSCIFSKVRGDDIYVTSQILENIMPPEYKPLAGIIPYLAIPAGAVIGYKLRDGLSYVQNRIHQAHIEDLIKNGKPYYDPVAMRGLYEE